MERNETNTGEGMENIQFVWWKRILVDGGGVHATQLGMQMFRDRCIVKGKEILFGDETRRLARRCAWSLRYNISGSTIHCSPFYRRGGMDRGHKDDSRILLWGGENRWVISFNLYVSLDDYWQLWEIKGWLMNRFSTDIGWIAIYLDLLSNHLNLERKIFFFLLVTESISFYGWSWNSWTSSTWRMSFSKKKWAASVDRNKFR